MEIRSVDAGRGGAWLVEGFELFKRDAGAWIGITVVGFLICIALHYIPMGSIAWQVVTPVLVGGLMLGCRSRDQGGEFGLDHLFAGFSHHASQLALVGVIYLAGVLVLVVIVIVAMLPFGLGVMQITHALESIRSGNLIMNPLLLFIPMLIALAASVPLFMAVWFAPARVVLADRKAVEALADSFNGCLRNVMPFLLYGILVLAISILACVTLMLGWLVAIPVFTASVYTAHKDIFPVTAPAAIEGGS